MKARPGLRALGLERRGVACHTQRYTNSDVRVRIDYRFVDSLL